MDTSEMQELLRGYLSELDWTNGVTKDDLMLHLADRDETLRTMLNEYISEGTYQTLDDVLTLVPVQAWQDTQGDRWQGAEIQFVEDVETNFRGGPVGRDESDVQQGPDSSTQTSGFGRSASASSRSSETAARGGSGAGSSGSNAGEVDLGVSGRNETIGETPEDRGGRDA